MVLVVILVFNNPLPQSHSLFFNYTNLNLEFHPQSILIIYVLIFGFGYLNLTIPL